MFHRIRLENFAVAERLEVALEPGLNILTGETGAGKSLLLDALGALCGHRAQRDWLREGADEAVVEGELGIDDALRRRLIERGLDVDDDVLVIRRTLSSSGKSRVYLGGRLSGTSELDALLSGSVEFVGQHAQVRLVEPQMQALQLDATLDPEQFHPARARYQAAYEAWQAAQTQRVALDRTASTADTEYLRFQVSQLQALAPHEGEDEALELSLKRLRSTAKRRQLLSEAATLIALDAEAHRALHRVAGLLRECALLDPGLEPTSAGAQGLMADAGELAAELERRAESCDLDGEALAAAEERLAALRAAQRRYGAASAGVLAERLKALQGTLREAESAAERRGALEQECAQLLARALEEGRALSTVRRQGIPALERTVSRTLSQLGMPGASFGVQLDASNLPDPNGLDTVSLRLAANRGEAQRTLSAAASGGELSRLLLALKAANWSNAGGVLVLDEIDTGVGGAEAEAMGRLLRRLGERTQLLCVSHSPQVSAWAHCHIRVQKQSSRGRVRSTATRLSTPDARAQELARMMSGATVSNHAIRASLALLESAGRASADQP